MRVHNLKNLSLRLPRRRLVVVTGPSGSGKSSLAFDTLYAEGQRRYIESLSSYAHQFLDQLAKPDDYTTIVVVEHLEERSMELGPLVCFACHDPHDPEM